MISVTELSQELGIPYKRLNRWIHEFGLGTKVGWALILTEDEVEMLKQKLAARKLEGRGKSGRPLILGEIPNGNTQTA